MNKQPPATFSERCVAMLIALVAIIAILILARAVRPEESNVKPCPEPNHLLSLKRSRTIMAPPKPSRAATEREKRSIEYLIGYYDGWIAGHQVGYEVGFRDGHKKGYDEGYEDAKQKYWKLGWKAAYAKGYTDCWERLYCEAANFDFHYPEDEPGAKMRRDLGFIRPKEK